MLDLLLRTRVETKLRAHEPDLVLGSLRPLGGGACQDLFLLEAGDERLVLRSDAAQALPGSLDPHIGRLREGYQPRSAFIRIPRLTSTLRSLTYWLAIPNSTCIISTLSEGL